MSPCEEGVGGGRVAEVAGVASTVRASGRQRQSELEFGCLFNGPGHQRGCWTVVNGEYVSPPSHAGGGR